VLIPCSRFTLATILLALPTTSTTSAAGAQSGSMAFSDLMAPSSVAAPRPRSWERAEDFKRKLEEEFEAKQQGLEEASRPKPALVTVKEAVSRFLNSKRNENLADSTLDKLTTIFEKQFLAWATSYGFVHITEITTADLEGFRDTWTDGPLAKKIGFLNNASCLYHVYVRGEVYLAAGQGGAAAEFQKVIDHSGIVWNCWTGGLAHLGVARASALQSRTSQGADADAARVRALAAYQDFLALWRDADPDIPILDEAKSEYAKLR